MMRRLKYLKNFLFLIIILSGFVAKAIEAPSNFDFDVDNVAYTITSNEEHTVEVSALLGDIGRILILPEMVEFSNGDFYKVSSIGAKAFQPNLYYHGGIEEFILPNTVERIGELAFNNNKNLKILSIPNSVKYIEQEAFKDCERLVTQIPTSLICLGNRAFSGCQSLQQLEIPATTVEIGTDAFYGCSSLREINVKEDNPVYSSMSGIVYNKDLTEFLFVPQGIEGEVTIPEGITELPDRIFYRCSALCSITFPEGLTSIGKNAFFNCSSLTEITLPEGLTSIGDWAFNQCGLTSVVIPESLKFLGEDVFILSLLERVEILAPLDTIPSGTFYSCKNLKEVVLPNTVKVLGDKSFYECESLQSIFIPASVETITAETFNGSYSLTEFIVDEENPWFTSEGPLLLSKDRSLLVDWPSAAGDVVLPDYISETARVLFEYQQRIRSLTFPASIKKIGGGICDDNLVLRSVYCYAVEPPEFEGGFWDIYEGRSLDITVYVPASSLELYRNNSRWNRYKLAPMKEENGVEALPEDGESAPESYTVFSIDGRLLLKGAEKSALQSLSSGIYIINGKKVVL